MPAHGIHTQVAYRVSRGVKSSKVPNRALRDNLGCAAFWAVTPCSLLPTGSAACCWGIVLTRGSTTSIAPRGEPPRRARTPSSCSARRAPPPCSLPPWRRWRLRRTISTRRRPLPQPPQSPRLSPLHPRCQTPRPRGRLRRTLTGLRFPVPSLLPLRWLRRRCLPRRSPSLQAFARSAPRHRRLSSSRCRSTAGFRTRDTQWRSRCSSKASPESCRLAPCGRRPCMHCRPSRALTCGSQVLRSPIPVGPRSLSVCANVCEMFMMILCFAS
jgi:hypothetical protein